MYHDDRSYPGCAASSSAIGRAIASPTTATAITFSAPISRRTSAASNRRLITTVLASRNAVNNVYVPAPCMSGAVSR